MANNRSRRCCTKARETFGDSRRERLIRLMSTPSNVCIHNRAVAFESSPVSWTILSLLRLLFLASGDLFDGLSLSSRSSTSLFSEGGCSSEKTSMPVREWWGERMTLLTRRRCGHTSLVSIVCHRNVHTYLVFSIILQKHRPLQDPSTRPTRHRSVSI